MSNSTSPLDQHIEQIKQLAADGSTNAEIVAVLRDQHGLVTSEASIRRAKKRAGFAPKSPADRTGSKRQPALAVNGDVATAISPVTGVPMSIEELMALYKLDPEEWEPEAPIASWWGDPAAPKYQLKVKFNRKKEVSFVVPARITGDYIAPKIRKSISRQPKIHLLIGCQQAPYEDRKMHAAFLSMIDDLKPHGLVAMGDTMDLPTVSKHADDEVWNASAQRCVDTGYRLLRDYRMAHESMEMFALRGNHDDRLKNEMLLRAERLHGIRPGKLEDEAPQRALMSLENMLRLDELGIELVEPSGRYVHAQLNIGNVALIHGNKTGPNAPMREIGRSIHSICQAHTHTQSIGKKVIYDIDGGRRTLTAVEIGTATQVKGGLGYAVKPDWINGGGVLLTHEDGTQNIELFEWDEKHIIWRDKLYA